MLLVVVSIVCLVCRLIFCSMVMLVLCVFVLVSFVKYGCSMVVLCVNVVVFMFV